MKVIVIDDDKVFVTVMRRILSAVPAVKKFECFSSADEVLPRMTKMKPDLVFSDIRMPGMDGIQFASRVKEAWPDAGLIMLSGSVDDETIFGAIKAGASGYLVKPVTKNEIVNAINVSKAGGASLSPGIAKQVLDAFRSHEDIPGDYSPVGREREVLSALVEGLGYKEIADRLSISIHTVHWHMKRIIAKLHARNKKDAILKAQRLGLEEGGSGGDAGPGRRDP